MEKRFAEDQNGILCPLSFKIQKTGHHFPVDQLNLNFAIPVTVILVL